LLNTLGREALGILTDWEHLKQTR